MTLPNPNCGVSYFIEIEQIKKRKMTQSLHPSAQKGFSLGAELYQQVRPNYPQEIVVWLQDRLKIGESSTVIDLGSGTGKFLPYLIQTGAKVLAIEPINEMLK